MKKLPELQLDPYYIEYAMDSCFHKVTRKERKYVYSVHRPQRLVEAGYLAKTETHPKRRGHDLEGSIWYWPTPEGLRWWIGERAKLADGAIKYRSDLSVLDPNNNEPYTIADLADAVEGKGIGAHILFYVCRYPTVWAAMRDGLLTFVSHRDYSGRPHSHKEYVTAALTKEGMAYFDGLPRLELECA